MICSLSFWGARARALSEKNCALSWYGAVWLPNFLDNNFPSVCFFRCDALILVVFDECKHWFADWLRKKTAVAAAVTAVVDVDDDGIKIKIERWSLRCCCLVSTKNAGKIRNTHMHQKASYLPIELNWTMKEQKEASTAVMWTHWTNLQ